MRSRWTRGSRWEAELGGGGSTGMGENSRLATPEAWGQGCREDGRIGYRDD